MSRAPYFRTRLSPDDRREVLWQSLYRYFFSRLIAEKDCVLDLGAGCGHFINQVSARKAIALDAWDGFVDWLRPGIEARIGDVTDLSFLAGSSVDFVFASNLFEHISQDDFSTVLHQLKRVLAPAGTLNILQPNYFYSYREYFDDYTHCTIYSHVSICDFLAANGYRVIDCRPRFLPLTMKSALPVSPLLIRLYLCSPWKPTGKQMFIRAVQDNFGESHHREPVRRSPRLPDRVAKHKIASASERHARTVFLQSIAAPTIDVFRGALRQAARDEGVVVLDRTKGCCSRPELNHPSP